MEQFSTRKFFSSKFIIENKLSFSTTVLLQDIYFWILSEKNPPKKIILNHKTFYYISQSHFVRFNYGLLNQARVNKIFSELKEIGIIESSFVKDEKENYINFNWIKIKESLLSDEELQSMEDIPWWKRIHAYADEQIRQEQAGTTETIYDTDYEIVKKGNRNCLVKKNKESDSKSYNNSEEKKMLFEMEDKKPRYEIESYSIVRKLIEKSRKENKDYFRHKYNEYGNEQTKLITKSCQFVQAIYNGNFLNPRQYPLSEKFTENQQFPIDISKVKEILNEVKGDWKKVKKLVVNAYDNFELMHQENYCPCNKSFLNRNISDWFYGYSDEAGKYQSQFIQCLFEIPLTKKFYSEKKADRIFEGLSSKSCEYGEQLIDLNPKMNSGTAWENIKKMTEWAKLVLSSERNASYWIGNPSEIIKRFVEWARNNNVQINTNSFDISWCVENNGPWVWFVQKAIQEYKLNYQLTSLVTADDFLDCYQSDVSFEEDGIIF